MIFPEEKNFFSFPSSCPVSLPLSAVLRLLWGKGHPTLQDHPNGEFQGEASTGGKGYNADVSAPL